MDKISKEYDYKNYNDYIALSKVNTKPFLMLSELIDNSISSFEKKFGDGMDNWEEKLIVNIEISLKTGDTKKSENNLVSFKNNFITVSDNAFGMDGNTLREAVKLNKRNVNNIGHKSSMNVHGRGLKQSAFYFGHYLNVVSNNGDESNEITLDAVGQSSLDNIAKFEVISKKRPKRGTTVTIKHLNDKNGAITYKKLGKIFMALSSRYSGFLSRKDKFEIVFKTPTVNGVGNLGYGTTMKKCLSKDEEYFKAKLKNFITIDDESDDIFLEKFVTPIFDFNRASIKQGVFKSVADLKARYITKCDAYRNNDSKHIDPEVFDISKNQIINLIEDVEAGESKKFKWEVRYKPENTSIKNKWVFSFYKIDGKQVPDKSKWRGIFIKEGHRFLMHGPILEGEQSTYVSWEKTTTTGSTQNSFGGVFNITIFDEISSHTDKSHMAISSDVQEEMDLIIYSAWKAFDMFEMVFRDRDANPNTANIADDEVVAAIENRFPEGGQVSYSVNSAKGNKSNKSIKINTDIDEENTGWDINIITGIHKNLSKIILDIKVIEKEKEFILTFNKDASIWSKADSSLKGIKLYTEFIIPMLMQLSVYFINMKLNKYGNDVQNFNNVIDEEL